MCEAGSPGGPLPIRKEARRGWHELMNVMAFLRGRLLVRIGLLLLLVLGAQSGAYGLSLDQARHLLARTGFEPTRQEMRALSDLTHEAAVDRLLTEIRTVAVSPAPLWANEAPPDFKLLRKASRDERKRARKQRRRWATDLRGWWLGEMVATESPLSERMVMFWHNHFTSSVQKVKVPQLLYRQNVKFRRLGTQNFAELLHAMVRDPALLMYLDNHRNRRGKPNENLARELLELFTLGEGHYREADIKQVARALSGHSVDKQTGAFKFRKRWHDAGRKKILGHGGKFDAKDVVDLLLAEPRTAELLSAKLWREFVDDTPPPSDVQRLAQVLRQNDYAVKPWLRALLTSSAFRNPRNAGTRIKSPTEFLVGLVRVFEVPMTKPERFASGLRRLGQDLFNPPNVKGWSGGEDWISADTLLVRQQVVARLLRGVAPSGRYENMMGSEQKPNRMRGNPIVNWLSKIPAAERSPEALQQLLLPIPPVQTESGTTLAPHDYVEALLLDPTYQLN
jgi:uncharacterized protein (DUF1800 family)